MSVFDVLKLLTDANGVAGDESEAAGVALELLKEYAPLAEFDKFGSVTGFIGDKSNGKPLILLDAHIDEIGLIVTRLSENDGGFIAAEPCGGVDRRLLPAQSVTVCGKTRVKGVVCALPPHVHKDSGKALKADEIRVDTGYSKEKLQELVSPGDRIVIDGELTRLANGRVCGKSLDDRAGVTAVLYALKLIKESGNCAYNIAVTFSSQEELGSRGAQISAYNADPEFAIIVDVSYGMSPGCPERKCGKLDGGPMIGYAPALDRDMFERLKTVAGKLGVPHQLEIMNRDTGGTNADVISLVKGGVKTALVSIPLRYMHTPVETASVADIENTGRLIAAFIGRAE